MVGKVTRETGQVEVRLRQDKSSELVPAAEAYERAIQLLEKLD